MHCLKYTQKGCFHEMKIGNVFMGLLQGMKMQFLGSTSIEIREFYKRRLNHMIRTIQYPV